MNPYFTQVPPSISNKGDRQQFVELLKTRPGHWALYKPGKAHSAAVAATFVTDFPGVEARCRRAGGAYDIYARWIGMNGDHP